MSRADKPDQLESLDDSTASADMKTTLGDDMAQQGALLMLIQNVERQGPFDAFGLFSVSITSLSSVMGTIVTYVIVLLQFQFC